MKQWDILQYETVRMDTWHYAFVKTHKMHDTNQKSESKYKFWQIMHLSKPIKCMTQKKSESKYKLWIWVRKKNLYKYINPRQSLSSGKQESKYYH
jgi:hypothetical protein